MRRIITLEDVISDARVIGLVCLQFGDTGKGGAIHKIAKLVRAIARGRGGPNAGHTYFHNGIEIVAHQLPSGIAYDKEGMISIMGHGMVVNPIGLVGELNQLDAAGMTHNNLRIDENVSVILEYHIKRDKENTTVAGGTIGSTGQGIGPCYEDHVARIGVFMRDLFDIDVLRRKIEQAKKKHPEISVDTDKIIEDLREPAKKIRQYVTNTVPELHSIIDSGQRVCLEGAQGTMLGVDTGQHPYITSSDSTIDGLCRGVGISANAVDLVFGVVKFPYMTRVGNGPLAPEFGGIESENYCKGDKVREHEKGIHDIFYEVNKFLGMGLDIDRIRALQKEGRLDEVSKYKKEAEAFIKAHSDQVIEMMNSPDPFIQGIGFRFAGLEYGATTSRPRRTGWTDASAARYAAKVNGLVGRNRKLQLILTKLDCASGIDEFRISYGYEGSDGLPREFTRDAEEFRTYRASDFETHKGYGSLSGIQSFEEMPEGLVRSIVRFEDFVGTTATILSTGKEDADKIYRLPKAA